MARMSDEALGIWLRQGDPADGRTVLSAGERLKMRREIVRQARLSESAREPQIRWAPALALITAAALLIGLALHLPRQLALHPQDTPARFEQTAAAPQAKRQTARDVLFVAPGGTRIIWKLDPEFNRNTSGG